MDDQGVDVVTRCPVPVPQIIYDVAERVLGVVPTDVRLFVELVDRGGHLGHTGRLCVLANGTDITLELLAAAGEPSENHWAEGPAHHTD